MLSALQAFVKPLLLITLTLAYCATALPAATLERLSLDDMIRQSTTVVRGKVLSSYSSTSGPVIFTNYRIQVTETLKGAAAASVDIQMPGGVANHLRQSFAGVPQLNAGDEFVFFLWSGKSGTVQVIGLTQGLFSVGKDSSTDPLLTRNASHEVMLEPKTGKQVQDQALSMHLSDLRMHIGTTLASATSQRTAK